MVPFIFRSTNHNSHSSLGSLIYCSSIDVLHIYDDKTELNFNFDNKPKKFVDVETGQELNIYADNIQSEYRLLINKYFKSLKNKCLQYKIDYVPVSIHKGYNEILTSYLLQRKNFK